MSSWAPPLSTSRGTPNSTNRDDHTDVNKHRQPHHVPSGSNSTFVNMECRTSTNELHHIYTNTNANTHAPPAVPHPPPSQPVSLTLMQSTNGAPMPAKPPHTTTFLSLPLELRLMVYRDVLVRSTIVDAFHVWDHQLPSPDCTGLLRVSRQISAEAAEVLYGENTFRYPFFNDNGYKLANAFSAANIARVRKLCVELKQCDYEARVPDWELWAPVLGRLTRLVVVARQWEPSEMFGDDGEEEDDDAQEAEEDDSEEEEEDEEEEEEEEDDDDQGSLATSKPSRPEWKDWVDSILSNFAQHVHPTLVLEFDDNDFSLETRTLVEKYFAGRFRKVRLGEYDFFFGRDAVCEYGHVCSENVLCSCWSTE